MVIKIINSPFGDNCIKKSGKIMMIHDYVTELRFHIKFPHIDARSEHMSS